MKKLRPPLEYVIKFCSGQSNQCSSLNKTGRCSKLLATDDEGTYCRLMSKALGKDVENTIIDGYCFNHPLNHDCKCINRSIYDSYSVAKEKHQIPDNCWYKPCLDETILNKDREAKNCPTNMCNIILDAHDDRDVAIRNNDINCNFTNGTTNIQGNDTFDEGMSKGTIITFILIIALLNILNMV
jgi:hypothetical protein